MNIRKIFRRWSALSGAFSLLVCMTNAGFASIGREVNASANNPPGPDRFSVTTIEYTEYTWWMARWGTNELICELKIDREGLPVSADIFSNCEKKDYQNWLQQKPCHEHDAALCKGSYLMLIDSQPAQKEIATKLPPPLVQITLENCDPVYTSSTSICELNPILALSGIEPLPDYEITHIEGRYEDQSFKCSAHCRLQLPTSAEEGSTLQFWAYSSYGDSSSIFNALIRVAPADIGDPDRSFWYVDVLSSQWAGVPVASCVQAWGALPPIGGPPNWLSTPTQSESLGTDVPYNYLAANLIRSGVVDASSCPHNGLLQESVVASACGLRKAREAVAQWQNQFDSIILNAAQDTGVPASLLKNLFAQESQFWPGIGSKRDVGLGQLTEHGADTTLLWNPPFFNQFCPRIMDSEACANGYLGLDESGREYARVALIREVNAICDDCPLGIDLDRANFSISVFAHTLLANCEQAGRLVKNVTGRTAGNAAAYEDLWKFSLVNYHAGPGCLGDALDAAFSEKMELTWENVSSKFSTGCASASKYVNNISK